MDTYIQVLWIIFQLFFLIFFTIFEFLKRFLSFEKFNFFYYSIFFTIFFTRAQDLHLSLVFVKKWTSIRTLVHEMVFSELLTTALTNCPLRILTLIFFSPAKTIHISFFAKNVRGNSKFGTEESFMKVCTV